ncbi:hypothetical protein, partial [Pontibaca methylaminivorans]|uniref:hypothetical protein n=1 Tax=Pontibaca methylaminivorans TaxID=515897 RepID=UPI002FDB426E
KVCGCNDPFPPHVSNRNEVPSGLLIFQFLRVSLRLRESQFLCGKFGAAGTRRTPSPPGVLSKIGAVSPQRFLESEMTARAANKNPIPRELPDTGCANA